MSIYDSSFDKDEGRIVFDVVPAPGTEDVGSNLFSIRYRNYYFENNNEDMKDPHIIYDIKYENKRYTDNNGENHDLYIFHIIDTHTRIKVHKRSLLFQIDANNIDLEFIIKDINTYHGIIRDFKKAIAVSKQSRLNMVNVASTLPLPNTSQSLIGSYISGHNGTIEQQRNAIIRQGGKRKTRKQCNQRKQRTRK